MYVRMGILSILERISVKIDNFKSEPTTAGYFFGAVFGVFFAGSGVWKISKIKILGDLYVVWQDWSLPILNFRGGHTSGRLPLIVRITGLFFRLPGRPMPGTDWRSAAAGRPAVGAALNAPA